MNARKKHILIIPLLFSFSIGLVAQTVYHHKGKKTPLTLNENKTDVNIPKDSVENTLENANELWDSRDSAASTPNICRDDLTFPNDPDFNKQWGLYNSDSFYLGIDISICPAWNYATGENVKIAVFDTGVDLNHIDLASNISDISYDTETHTSPSRVYKNHATHCAGIAAAVKDNSIHIAGVAPDAKIVSISSPMRKKTEHLPLKLAEGIRWAYQNGADIISNSWRFLYPHPEIENAIHEAFIYGRQGKGCIIVFSTGNGGMDSISFPANCNDTILAVGSIRRTGSRDEDSQYGIGLDIVAPGGKIYSTLPNDTVGYMSGTSMACPHVAGVAALVLERDPELTVTQVNSIICRNAKKISGVSFNETKPDGSWNEEYGYGLVDAYSSVINTPKIVYIQNDTITGTRTISADIIYVGRDVADRKEHGDVILGQGDITLNAKSVTIKNSTTVPLGTKLIIGNQ